MKNEIETNQFYWRNWKLSFAILQPFCPGEMSWNVAQKVAIKVIIFRVWGELVIFQQQSQQNDI